MNTIVQQSVAKINKDFFSPPELTAGLYKATTIIINSS